jgi:branched-chain amino acid transport system permease protein
MIWGGQDVRITGPLSNDGFSLGGETLVFSPLKLLILASVVVLMLMLSILFQKTNIGLAFVHLPMLQRSHAYQESKWI